MKFQQVYYVLDTEFRILWVGGEWDEFALANSGANARSNEVLATSLMAHVADQTTRDVLARVITAVIDAQKPLRIDYRCDSSTMLRRFQMTVQPMKEGRVLLVHDLRDAKSFARPHVPWQHDKTASDFKCSFCNSVRLQGAEHWVAPENLDIEHPERVAYSICEPCEGRVTEVIEALGEGLHPSRTSTAGFGPDQQ